MSELQKKHKQLKRLRIRNITLNTVCILLALAGISWTINYFWKYVHYEITNDAVVDQYIAPLNIRASGYIKEVRFTEHQPVHAGDTLLILDNREYLIKVKDAEAALMDAKGAKDVLKFRHSDLASKCSHSGSQHCRNQGQALATGTGLSPLCQPACRRIRQPATI